MNATTMIGGVRRRRIRIITQRIARRGAVLAWLSVCVGGLCLVPRVHAQTLFDWAGTPPDITRYSVQACLALIESVDDSVQRKQIRYDTLPLASSDTITRGSPAVVAVARQCSANLSVDQFFPKEPLRVGEMHDAYRVFLAAGRLPEALVFSERWLASVPVSDDTLWTTIQRHIIEELMLARPAQFAEAFRRIDAMETQRFRFKEALMIALFHEARKLPDTATIHHIGEWVLRVTQTLPDSVTLGSEWTQVLTAHKRSALMDSLRVSTQSYLTYQAALKKQVKMDIAELKRAAPIVGSFWFPSRPTQPRPTLGHVSVVAYITDNECGEVNECPSKLAVLRRLVERFPSVEFTLLAHTHGYHGLVAEPPTPAREAALIDSVYRQVPKLPVTTSVYATTFWRVEAPDRRRINDASPNDQFYRSKGGELLYVVDREGLVLEMAPWDVQGEAVVRDLLEALVQQPSQQSQPRRN